VTGVQDVCSSDLKHGKIHKPYDAIWFEDSATEIGKYVTKALDIKK
jgi:hypothetical protein